MLKGERFQPNIDNILMRARLVKIKELVEALGRELEGKYKSVSLENTIRNVVSELEFIDDFASGADVSKVESDTYVDLVPDLIVKVAMKARTIARHFKKKQYSEKSIIATHDLLAELDWLDDVIIDVDLLKSFSHEIIEGNNKSIEKVASSVHDIQEKIENLKEDYNSTIAQNTYRFSQISDGIDALERRADLEIEKIRTSHSEVMSEIDKKNGQINDVLDLASTRFISVDYDRSVQDEKKVADWLRYGSLACMVLIAVMLGYTFWETTKTEFNWQQSLFRITLTFLLSVPAAYLARESAKHRKQQYQHLQISLDLKAIPSFIGSLPVEEQNKFKLEVANKIFASRESQNDQDPYPINVQEVVMALLRKFEDVPAAKDKKPNGN